MTKEVHDRTWRTLETCRLCLKHIAFYRAGWRVGRYRACGMFWQNANSAFFGLAVSEWCKLFADRKGKHHWSGIVENQKRFEWDFFRRLRKTEPEFDDYVRMVKSARDKAVDPLDEQTAGQMPNLRNARMTVAYLHDHLLALPELNHSLAEAERALAASLYSEWFSVACLEYQSAAARLRHVNPP